MQLSATERQKSLPRGVSLVAEFNNPRLNGVLKRAILAHAVGFSLLELMITLAVGLVLTLIAVPLTQNASQYFKMRGAVSSVTSAIQSTRFQAISQGCPYQIAFTASSGTYQIQGQPYSAAANSCAAAFTNVCSGTLASCPVPVSPVTLNADVTLVFRPGGSVTSPQFPLGGINMVLTYGKQPAETITVSGYGTTSVNP